MYIKLINDLSNTITKLDNVQFITFFNQAELTIDLGVAPSGNYSFQILLFNANQNVIATVRCDSSTVVNIVTGNKTFTSTVTGTILKLTANDKLWGITTVIIDSNF